MCSRKFLIYENKRPENSNKITNYTKIFHSWFLMGFFSQPFQNWNLKSGFRHQNDIFMDTFIIITLDTNHNRPTISTSTKLIEPGQHAKKEWTHIRPRAVPHTHGYMDRWVTWQSTVTSFGFLNCFVYRRDICVDSSSLHILLA